MMRTIARKLRDGQTEAETVLWNELRNRKLSGHKFVRQYPVSVEDNGKNRFFVIDFYCHEAKLAIELDGSFHEDREHADQYRELLLVEKAMKVIRFTNDEVLDAKRQVLKVIANHLPEHSSPLSLERGAGGES
jgi:very-short-patch-repair endonuclease